MDIRKRPELPKKPTLSKPSEGDEKPKGIIGDCLPGPFPGPRPPIKLDRDRMEFRRRDEDKSGTLTSDEYGVGKKKQDEFRRYDRNDDGEVSLKEFKLGRFLDRLRKGDIEIKPLPMPFPKLPEGGFNPVPMPFPKLPEDGLKPVPMPSPKGPVFLAGEASVGDLVAKAKQAQDEI